jgi:hypothetical protein
MAPVLCGKPVGSRKLRPKINSTLTHKHERKGENIVLVNCMVIHHRVVQPTATERGQSFNVFCAAVFTNVV